MRDKKGFTLIEILIVVLLIGVFFFVAVPKFQDITQVNLKSSSRRLSATIKYLYNEAAFKKNIYRLQFDVQRGEYWVEVLQGNEFVTLPGPMFRRKQLPAGVSFKEVFSERSLRSAARDSEEFIVFLPTGFVEPAVIYLQTENGDYYTLATKPYTGGTRVYDEYVEVFER